MSDDYYGFIDAVGFAYHEEMVLGGKCAFRFREFIDQEHYCECDYPAYRIARTLMADVALHEDLKFHEDMGYGKNGEPRRLCSGNAHQVCPKHKMPLECLNDYIGGGSHYWYLRCPSCNSDFYYDTYRFKLEEGRN